MSDTVAPQEGKFYRTRDGRKVGPAEPAKWPSPGLAWSLNSEWLYADNGVCGYGDREDSDLVAEWTEGPVVTEMVKRIVPGVYGNVSVLGSGSMSVNLKFDNGLYDSSDLRDLAATLTALADAL